MYRPHILIDADIPFIHGRLEPLADVKYVSQDDFTPSLVSDADALLIRTRTRCDGALLSNSRVRLIATATIGTDQIDLPWCTAHGITARNSPGCNAPGVAQYVWASLLRMGIEPAKTIIGVVGYGNVGSIVADWGRRLGATVRVCDPPRAEAGYTDANYEPLKTLMAECDVVTFHTPLTYSGPHSTFHLADAAKLNLMRPGAILVNAARGPVVDNEALKEAIRKRGLHTVIDTWEGEPVLDTELLGMCDIGTFHIAGYSRQGKERATRMVLEACDDFFGWNTDKSGLAGPRPANEQVTAEAITESFDPYPVMEALRREPQAFERLRKEYIFRDEPAFPESANI